MSQSSNNEALINKLYAAAGAGDWAQVETLITPDFRFVESDGLPMGGTYRGIREYRALFESVMQGAGRIEMDFTAMTSSETHVIVLLTLHFLDHDVHAPVAEAFRISDGRVAEIVPYYLNPQTASKAFASIPELIRKKLSR
jgi:ketosteroid isomerase-like protein